MTPNPSMTGSFKMTLPNDLLKALQTTPVEDPGKDLQLRGLKPSLLDRVFSLFSGSRRRG
ncbi:MAG TPA: hypothetical protein VKB41_12495 [Steroidobacteraceae bacterium]|jgi:hypothetical protein|nr:hypothetical protein [Steroidobacteraceae bacterium]